MENSQQEFKKYFPGQKLLYPFNLSSTVRSNLWPSLGVVPKQINKKSSDHLESANIDKPEGRSE